MIGIEELVVGDAPEAWAAAGFTVDPDAVVRIGAVRVRLVGRDHGKRLLGWRLSGIDPDGLDQAQAGVPVEPGEGPIPATTLDGLPTAAAPADPCAPAEHPNGVVAIDHVVLLTPDSGRTTSALEGVGFDVRRRRPTDQYGAPMVQTFFRAGAVIVELIGPPEPMGDGPAGFFGLAHVVADLEATAATLGPAMGAPKDAVQAGRRIATLRHREVGMSVATAFMTAEPAR